MPERPTGNVRDKTVAASTFVGRHREMTQVRLLLRSARLVTLTGVGGSGKTRLAQKVATRLRSTFRDGICWVDLAPLADGSLLAYRIAEELGVRDHSDRAMSDVVVNHLRQRELLLVLDNCEHLLNCCAQLTDRALRAAAGLRILCTSRQPLDVVGEHILVVPPLPVPDPDEPPSSIASARNPAVALFIDRAAAAAPTFRATRHHRVTIAHVCRRLDGLPLAIELAAAQLGTLSLDDLAAQLRDRFEVLAARDMPPGRHRTLQATFDWSYTLCTPAEQALWARVAVFAGSFDLAAATAVCADADVPARDVLLLLAGLVDKSIVIREDWSGGSRFRLLETVREYGLFRLRASGGEVRAGLSGRLRDWCVELTARFAAEWFGSDQERWLAQLRVEYANLRAVLGWCLATPGEAAAGLRMAADLHYFWWASGGSHECRYWLDRALRADPRPAAARAAALSAYSMVLTLHGAFAAAQTAARECLALAQKLDAPLFVARALSALGTAIMHSGDLPSARPLQEEAVSRFAALGVVDTEVGLAQVSLAMVNLLEGDLASAAALSAHSVAECRTRGERWWLGYALISSTLVALAVDDFANAERYARESLHLRADLGDTLGMAGSLERLAWIAALVGDMRRAARLLGAADRLWRIVARPLYGSPQWLRGREKCQTSARQALGDEAFEAAFHDGAQLSTAEAVSYALGEHQQPSATAAATGPATVTQLTGQETHIAELVAQGLSNKQIAARLVISQRAAGGHVNSILRKLGFTTRTQLATWVVRSPNRPTN